MSGRDDTSDSAILSGVASYYAGKLMEFGATARGVDWNGDTSHQLRHRQFLRLIGNDRDASVIDLGCGFGDFYRVLRAEGHRGAFTGYDVAPAMIDAARRIHGENNDCNWRVGTDPAQHADYAIGSGILNVKAGTTDSAWQAFVARTIDVLARNATRGFGFNVLSLSSDPERRQPDLHYADPVAMLAYCLSRYGRNVALLQDYGLYEFTILIRR